MGRITIETSNKTHIVGHKLSHPEAINEREMNAIRAGFFNQLIPVQAEHGKKDIVLKSTVDDMISLKTYFQAIVNKKMFLDVILQLVTIVKECEKKLMNTNNLMLDIDYIFLDPQTKNIKCIFWPIVNNQNPRYTYTFFSDLPFNIVFNKYEDNSYVTQYVKHIKSNNPFSINNSLKNDAAKKKDNVKKKESKKDSKNEEDDEDEDFLNLTDEEKDARDYQLQRAMDMVRAL